MPLESAYWVHICLYSADSPVELSVADKKFGIQQYTPRSLDDIQRKVDRPLDARFSPLTVQSWSQPAGEAASRKQAAMSPRQNGRRKENSVIANSTPEAPTSPIRSRVIDESPVASPASSTHARSNTTLSTPVARFIKESSFSVDDDEGGSKSSSALEISFGIVHLFRDDAAMQETTNVKTQTALEDDSGTILAILGVPSHMGPADFLQYIEPASSVISQVRMIREERAQRCMVLIKFREATSAEEFYKMYADQPFNLHDEPDELCRVVYVTKVSISTTSTLPFAYPLLANSDPWPIVTNNVTVSGNIDLSQRPPASVSVELPTCPVCLERMDSSVTGLMTVTCQHTFHCSCLSRWSDSRCPVCRYTQSRMIKKGHYTMPSFVPEHGCCSICGTGSDLWVCLICATVGCGRYKAGHAHRHHQETGHLYSLELETQRVWDYAGDGYVHRLIQNKAESKAADEGGPAPMSYRNAVTSSKGGHQMEASGSAAGQSGSKGPEMSELEEKMEAIGLEYSHLLSTQLESQRAFYEDQVRVQQRRADDMEKETIRLSLQVDQAETQSSDLKRSLDVVSSRYDSAYKNLERSLGKIKALDDDLKGERLMSKGLIGKIDRMEAENAVRSGEMAKLQNDNRELQEQVRDLMVFLETREVIEREGGEELRGGDVEVGKKGQKIKAAEDEAPTQGPTEGSAKTAPAKKKKKAKGKPSLGATSTDTTRSSKEEAAADIDVGEVP